MRRFLSIITVASRKFSIPLYSDKYIIMDYDGTKQENRQPTLTKNVACAAIPKRSGRVFFMSHNLLSINAQVSIKINRDTAIFLNKCFLIFTGMPSVMAINCGRLPKGFITAITAMVAKNIAYTADSIFANIIIP